MSRLTLSDLKAQGFELTKDEATELLPHISRHSQHGHELNVVYEGDEEEDDSDKKASKKSKVKEQPAPVDTDDDDVLSPEEEGEVMGYLNITTDNTPSEYKAVIEAFLADPTQVILDNRRVKLQNKVAALEAEIIADQSQGDELLVLSPEENEELFAKLGMTDTNTPTEYRDAIAVYLENEPRQKMPFNPIKLKNKIEAINAELNKSNTGSGSTEGTGELTRAQKAAITRAANKAAGTAGK